MKRLVFLTTVASPHQVRFIPYLRKYYDADFYFYEQLGGRQSWWKVDLGEHGHLLPCKFKWHNKYFTWAVLKVLREKKPDILMLGGFSVPANLLAYWWGHWHGCKIVVQTERSRVMSTGEARGYTLTWRLLRWLYRKVDVVLTTAPDIVPQFRDTFHFGDKVAGAQYPSDIDRYYEHPIRTKKEAYTLIYPNRMTEIYNPIGAVEIFAEVLRRYPKTLLKMNAAGELRPQVESRIKELGISASVEFLDHIKSWDELGEVYKSCDIMYLPAKYSNGNYTICECLVSGMGCVISDRILGDSVETQKEYGLGFIVPLDNQRFVEKICWYIEHPEVFDDSARRSREAFYPRTLAGTADLYKKIFDERFA